jgi:prefoldin subunit 5
MVKAQIDITKIFQMKRPEDAIKMIKQGIEVLNKWRKEFQATKKDIEDQQTVKKWDFQSQKEIFSAPIYMVQVLNDLAEAHTIIQEFLAILGPDLKQVTGSAEDIDEKISQVKGQVRNLE